MNTPNRNILILLIILLFLGAGFTYYYFKGLRIAITNNSGTLMYVNCYSNSNIEKFDNDVPANESSTKLIFLNSGARLTCSFMANGYSEEKSLVVGYYNENIKDVALSFESSTNHRVITVYSTEDAKIVITELKASE